MADAERWLWISLPHATFGIAVARDGAPDWRVLDAAPIARWTIGKRGPDVADYFRRRGARTEWIDT